MSDEYRSIIYRGSEDRNREYKQSFPWSRSTHGRTMAKVTKSILAIGNLRDGGHIVIGVEETSPGNFEPAGVGDDHLETFSFDDMADFVRNYADPYVSFDLSTVALDHMNFLIVSVSGFDKVPVICKRSYGDALSEGTIYVRSRSGRPRSEPISNYADMRELMDQAIERGVISYLEMRARIEPVGLTDQDKFDQQLGDFS